MSPGRTGAGTSGRKRRRFRFSLNALAIQLSAFALSFTLVAVLVVSGSQAAFVEQNETVANYVPPPAAPSGHPDDRAPRRPALLPGTPGAPSTAPTSASPAPEPRPVTKVALSDSDAGTAMFGDLTLVPGAAVDRCIEVTYSGNGGPTPVRLYTGEVTGALAPYLDLRIEVGADLDGAFGSCGGFRSEATLFTGTLAEFDADHHSYSSGLPTWGPADAREGRTFRFAVSVHDSPDAAGKSAGFGFTWRIEQP